MIYLFVLDDSLTCWGFTTRTEQLAKCCEPGWGYAPVKPVEAPPPPTHTYFFTDRSKAILLLWFHLFYVLESNSCTVLTLCIICIYARLTEWPTVGK